MRKIMKLFLLLFLGSLVVTFSSCNKNKETTDQKEIIYNLAVESGYTGTYEEWLESIKGDYIELSVTNTHIVWKYSNESAWRDLIELSKLSGEDKTVEFRVNEGYLEWKYTTDTVWTKLYEINTSSSSNKKETITVTFVTDWEMSGYFESEENIVIKESVQRTMNVGNILEPTDILKDGETCNGWYYYDKYNGMTLWLFDAYYASKDITLYGVIDTMYTVSYLDEYNELLYKYSFCENDYAYDLSYDVIQSGYEFIGWTENGVDLFDFYQPINHNVVLKPLLKEYGGNTVNVYLNYNGQSGITYQETDSYYNRIDGKVYTGGDLLPTWKAFSDNLGIKIKDVASYTETKDNDVYWSVQTRGYTGVDGSYIDLFYNSTANIAKMASAGEAVDLLPYLESGQMPYFEAYLNENPEVLDMCVTYDYYGNKHLYYTPYFDGYQQIERMFIMDTEMVERVLTYGAGDSDSAIGYNRLNGAYYQPFMDEQYNYKDANTKIKVVKNDSVVDVNIVQTTNIIKQQNDLLANNLTTGLDLVNQLQSYLKTAYPTYADNLADIYIGENAIYNADDLIALMRVIRANPVTATGSQLAYYTGVEILFPRGQSANRMENILDFAQIWGIQGLDSEANNLYFDGQGKLNVLGGMQASYDALVLLNQIYNEGLILRDFYDKGMGNSTYHLDYYYKNTKTDSLAGFMMYDYCASTTAGNDMDTNGIGTNISSRTGIYANTSRKGIRPVLAPVTYWNTLYEDVDTNSLFTSNGVCSNRSKKTLTRYYESNRSLKTNSWCIPYNSKNVESAIKLMDYMYSNDGFNINNFGPEKYRGEMSSDIIYGESVPTISDTLTKMYLESGTDFYTFMRKYIGATNGIGHERSNALEMQVTNQYAQVGLKNVQKAISLGVMTLATCTTPENYGFGASVPTNWQVSENSSAYSNYQNLANFWKASGTGMTGWRAVVIAAIGTNLSNVYVDAEITYSQVLEERVAFNRLYLYVWSESIGCTPSWLK